MSNVLEVPKSKLHNHFTFIKTKADGTEEVVGKAENVVLNRFLTYAMGPYTFERIGMSTGTGTPTADRTGFFNTSNIKQAVASSINRQYADNVLTLSMSFVYGTTEANNLLFTEVGLYLSSNYLVTHALITDSEGNPITLTKTNTEILTINATVYAEHPFVDDTGGGLNWVSPAFCNPFIRAASGDHLYTSTSNQADKVLPSTISAYNSRTRGQLPPYMLATSGTNANTGTAAAEYNLKTTVGTDVGNGTFIYGQTFTNTCAILEEDKDGFQGYLHTDMVVGTGDGERVAMNLPRADEIIGDVEVYLDDVLQDPSTYTVNHKGGGLAIETYSVFVGGTYQDNHKHTVYNSAYNGKYLIVAHKPRDASGVALSIYRVDHTGQTPHELISEEVFEYTTVSITTCVLTFLREDVLVLPNGTIAEFDNVSGRIGALFSCGSTDGNLLSSASYAYFTNKWYVFELNPGVLYVSYSNTIVNRLISIDIENKTYANVVGSTVRYSASYSYTTQFIGKAENTFVLGYSGSQSLYSYRYDPDTLNVTGMGSTTNTYRMAIVDDNGDAIGFFNGSGSIVPYNRETGAFGTLVTTPSVSIGYSAEFPSNIGGNNVAGSAYNVGGGWYLVTLYTKHTKNQFEFNPTLGQARVTPNALNGVNVFSNYYAIDNASPVASDGSLKEGFYLTSSYASAYAVAQKTSEDRFRYVFAGKVSTAAPHITFNTPPPLGVVIKATYRTVGLYKHNRLIVTLTGTRNLYSL